MTGMISRKAVGLGRLAAGVLVFVLGVVWADPVGLAAWYFTGEAEGRGHGGAGAHTLSLLLVVFGFVLAVAGGGAGEAMGTRKRA